MELEALDKAVDEAFGRKPEQPGRAPAAAPAARQQMPAPMRANNPGALMPGGKMAQYQSMEEGLQALDRNLAGYGKRGIDTIEGVINTWSPGNAPGNSPEATRNYIAHVAKVTGLSPTDKIDLSNPLVRHQISAGITQFENGPQVVYGRQPAAPTTRPAAASAAPEPAMGGMDLSNLDAAVQTAMTAPPPPTTGGKVASKVSEFLRGTGRSAASLIDTGLNAVTGGLDVAAYPLARAYYGQQMPAEAAAAKAKAETTSPKDILGTALGITKTPEYQGEASRRAMEYVGTHINEGIDAIQHGLISMGITLPKADVENMINQATFLVPGAVKGVAKSKVGQAIGREAGYAGEAVKYLTPEPIQRAVGGVVEAVAPGTVKPTRPPAPTFAPPAAEAQQLAPYAQPTRGSVGAAATSNPTMIRAALENATPEFQQLYGSMPLDKVNTPTVLRHLEGDSLPVPVRLLQGQATGDLVQLSREQNLRGSNPEIAYRIQEQNQALVDNVPAIRERVAPDVYSPKTIDSSQSIIDSYLKLDEARNTQIRDAYKALENANGGQFPVDGATLAQNADALLHKKLKTEFLPASIRSQLDRFRSGEPMTFEQFEAMRTNLAAEIRKAERSGDGNAAISSSLVRQALEDLPMTGETAALKPLADTARSLAKERFDALRKDPAYRAAVNDTIPADKFLEKFVINGHNKNVRTMVDTLGSGSEGHQHMAAGTINWLGDRAGIVEGRGNFSQANYNKALKKLDDVNNLQQIFTPEGQTYLRTLGNVANYTQFQPRGSFVNNSNTLVGYLAEKGAGGLETAANVVGLKTIGYPAGSEARRLIGQARERKFARESLEPGAGSKISDMAKVGRKKKPVAASAAEAQRTEPTLGTE
jgi:hypothetical protein